jgi:putative ABC transport system permease protein
MTMFVELMPASLVQAMIVSLLAIGIMISFKIINFPDFTPEGSYPFAGAVCSALIVGGVHPGVATIIACISAGSMGVATAFLHLHLRINGLLAGIIISTMIYSLNIKLIGAQNIDLTGFENLFSTISDNIIYKILSLIGLNIIIIVPILLFFQTSIGLRLRAVGANPKFAAKQGINISTYTIVALFIANALCGLSSSIIVQIQGQADIDIGVGVVVHALAALMIGEFILNPNNITTQILAPCLGSLVYTQLQAIAILIGFAESDLKFFTGTIVLLILAIRHYTRSDATTSHRLHQTLV